MSMIHLIILFLFSIGLIIFLSLLDRQHANVIIFYTLLIILFIPFKYLLPFNKSFIVNDILILLTFLYYSIKNAGIRKRFDKTFSHLLILIILFGIGLIYSIFFSYSFQSSSSYSYYLSIRLLVIYYLYFNLIENQNYYKRFVLIIHYLIFIVCSYLLIEFLSIYNSPGQVIRLISGQEVWDSYYSTLASSWEEGSLIPWLGGTNSRAKLLLLFFAFNLSMKYYCSNLFYKILRLVNILFTSLVLILQFSKSAYIFYCIIILVYGYYSFEWKLKSVGTFIFTLLLTIMFYNTIIENKIAMNRIDYAMTEKKSISNRKMLVIEGLDYAKQNYFLGNGFESVRLNDSYLTLHYTKLGKDNTHNTFLGVLIDVGFMGLFMIIIFFKRIINNSRSLIKLGSNKLLNNVGIAGYTVTIVFILSAFVSHGLFSSPQQFAPLFIIIIAATNKLKILSEITNNKAHDYFLIRNE